MCTGTSKEVSTHCAVPYKRKEIKMKTIKRIAWGILATIGFILIIYIMVIQWICTGKYDVYDKFMDSMVKLAIKWKL